MTYRSQFAEHLPPFNYAIGVDGGIVVITHTIHLGVDKSIHQKEAEDKLPTRALISLDICNMFNDISCQKLREIISKEYPELEVFADLLYKDDGQTSVKMVDGTWTYISV